MSESASAIYEAVNSMHIFYHRTARERTPGVCLHVEERRWELGEDL